jgi:microcystin-dependent protein
MDAYIGEVRAFGFNFIPQGWVRCDGTLYSAQSYPALYALLGNTYGGTPGQNFAVPNLQGFAVMGAGTGPGLTPRQVGKTYGATTVTLNGINQLPPHNHTLSLVRPTMTNLSQTMQGTPVANTSWLTQVQQVKTDTTTNGVPAYTKYTGQSPNATLHDATIGIAGGNADGSTAAHENRQPYLAMCFYICIDGIFPTGQ